MAREEESDQQFRDFLQQESANPAFAACLYHDDENNQQPDLEGRSIRADEQTVVSDVTMHSESLFRGSLYQMPMELQEPDEDVANLFNTNPATNRQPAVILPNRPLPTVTEIDEKIDLKPEKRRPVSFDDAKKHLEDPDLKKKPVSSNPIGNSVSATGMEGIDDMLAKIVARRSHDVTMSDGDLFVGHGNEEIAIDFGPETDDDLPGAYKGAPGADYGRIEKIPLPQHLRGDATQRQMDEKEIDAPQGAEPSQEWSFQEVDQAESARKKKRCRTLLIAVGIPFLLLAIILPTVLPLGGDYEGREEAEMDALDSQSPEEIVLLPNMTRSTLEALKDPESYQSWAYDWVENDPDWAAYEPWQKQQRFAMACIFYSFWFAMGHKDNENDFFHWKWMQHDLNECEWQGQLPSGGCDVDGRIANLTFSRITFQFTSYNVGKVLLKNTLVPHEIAFLTQLETIKLSFKMKADLETLLPNKTTNSLPALKMLDVSDCSLSGTIPWTLGRLTALTSLDLSLNELTSTIPSELGLLFNLRSLDLSWNNFSGTTPNEIELLPYLTEFSVDNNALIMEPQQQPGTYDTVCAGLGC